MSTPADTDFRAFGGEVIHREARLDGPGGSTRTRPHTSLGRRPVCSCSIAQPGNKWATECPTRENANSAAQHGATRRGLGRSGGLRPAACGRRDSTTDPWPGRKLRDDLPLKAHRGHAKPPQPKPLTSANPHPTWQGSWVDLVRDDRRPLSLTWPTTRRQHMDGRTGLR